MPYGSAFSLIISLKGKLREYIPCPPKLQFLAYCPHPLPRVSSPIPPLPSIKPNPNPKPNTPQWPAVAGPRRGSPTRLPVAAVLFPPHPAVYEEELELQLADIRRLSADNRRLADDRVALQRELAAARDEVRRLDAAAAEVRHQHLSRNREMIDNGLKLEAELRALEPLRIEVTQLRADVQKAEALRQEQVQGVTKKIEKLRADAQQIAPLKAEAEALQQELLRARSAIEYEKKGNTELVEQRMAMEKNLVTMAREIEKLRVDLSSIEARGRGSIYEGGPYGMKLTSPDRGFPSYADGYGLNRGAGEKSTFYGAGAGAWSAYDSSRTMNR